MNMDLHRIPLFNVEQEYTIVTYMYIVHVHTENT